jgi:hypothetical protein
MHRFDSGRRLLFFLTAAALSTSACHDPPTPPPSHPPADLPRWSKAPHVRWAGLGAAAPPPLAVFVDDPGGLVDRIAADDDVATFLNDRFTPVFLVPASSPLERGVSFLDGDGCLLLGPTTPGSPPEFIELANDLLVRLVAGSVTPVSAEPLIPPEPLELPSESPLRLACVAARR